LFFAFADSPEGGKKVAAADVSEAKAYLLHIAKNKPTNGLTAHTVDASRLLEEVASLPNLARALLNVARNRGAAGVDGCSVEEVVESARSVLPKLCRVLLSGSYRPGDIRRVWIPKPGGGQRGLGIPTVVDRWVQQAILQVLEPHFEPFFHNSSHGFRPHRGAHTAIAEAKRYVAAGFNVVVDLDLSKFFDRVHHQRLLSRVARQIQDARILRLIRLMLKAKVVMPDGTKVSTEQGTPQGGPLSPLLSNIVLDELDQELQRRSLRFVRYADDCNIFVRSERAGRRVMDSARRFIEGRLRLQVNEEKSSVACPEDLHFLGFRLRLNDEGKVEVHISKRTKQRLDARIRELTPRTWGQSLKVCLEQLNQYLKGWVAYFRICTQEGAEIFWRFDAHIRRRIRAIIIHQKKRPRHLYRHLLACGVSPPAAAGTAFRRRGIWKRSNLPGMTQAYRNVWFADRLVSLWSKWNEFNPPAWVLGQQLLLFD
jgi:group II intron reverse transcriptase/maturase